MACNGSINFAISIMVVGLSMIVVSLATAIAYKLIRNVLR